jgi:hypothetical protein
LLDPIYGHFNTPHRSYTRISLARNSWPGIGITSPSTEQQTLPLPALFRPTNRP